MKHYITFSAGLLALFFAFWAVSITDKTSPLRIPAGGMEEDKNARREWKNKRLADPLTGKIPENVRLMESEFIKNASLTQARTTQNLTWTQRGPYNVGGRTRAFAMDITNENRLFAGGVSGGLWKSEDAGASWVRVSPTYEHPGVVSIAQDTRPGKTHNWYYLSGECYGTSASGGGAFYLGDGLFKSSDNGNTWQPVAATAGGNQNSFSNFFQTGWRVVTRPFNATQDELYMATIGAVYKSLDGGATWQAARGGSTSNYSYHTDVAITSTGVIYITMSSDGPQKGIWRSENGSLWTNITPANYPATYDRMVIGINPNNENEVYFLGSTPGSGHNTNFLGSDDWSSFYKYTYLSGNGQGANGQWEDLTPNLPNGGGIFDKFSCQGGYDLAVYVKPGTNHVYIGSTSLWRSTDGFTTPNNTTHIGGYKPNTTMPFFELYPNHHPDIHALGFLPSNPNIMYSASDGGVHKTLDNTAANVVWESCNNGYFTSQFYSIGMDKATPGDPMMIGGLQDNGNFFSNQTSPNDTWKMTVNGDGAYLGISPNKTYYYLSIQKGKIVKCQIDNLGTVTNFKRIDPIGGKDYLFINPLVLDPSDDNLMYVAGGHRVWRNNSLNSIPLDGGWDSIAVGWTSYPDTTSGIISAIACSKLAPAHQLYYGTDKGKIFRISNAHIGNNNSTDISIAGVNAYLSCLAIDPTNGNHVIAVYSNYNVYSLYYTEDAGTTWKKIGGNLETTLSGNTGNVPSLRWACILPLSTGAKKYFVGTSVGLYSADSLIEHSASVGGTLWQWESPTVLGTTVVNMVEAREGDGYVAVATHGNGVFTTNAENWIGNDLPVKVADISFYPNPAKESLFFLIPLLKPTKITLKIYDMTGKWIQTDSKEFAFSGNRIFPVSLPTLTAGVYTYQMYGDDMPLKSGKFIVQ